MENTALAVLRSGSLLPDDAAFFIVSAWVDLAISDEFERYLEEDPGMVENFARARVMGSEKYPIAIVHLCLLSALSFARACVMGFEIDLKS